MHGTSLWDHIKSFLTHSQLLSIHFILPQSLNYAPVSFHTLSKLVLHPLYGLSCKCTSYIWFYYLIHQPIILYSLNILKASQLTLFCLSCQVSYNTYHPSHFPLYLTPFIQVTQHVLLRQITYIKITSRPQLTYSKYSALYSVIGTTISSYNILFIQGPYFQTVYSYLQKLFLLPSTSHSNTTVNPRHFMIQNILVK